MNKPSNVGALLKKIKLLEQLNKNLAVQGKNKNAYNIHKLNRFNSAVSAQRIGTAIAPVDIAWLGDSTLEVNSELGHTIASSKKTIAYLVNKVFENEFGSAGEGFIGARFPNNANPGVWSTSGDVVHDSVSGVNGWCTLSFGRQILNAVGASESRQFHGTGIQLYFEAITNSSFNPSTANITVDGVLKSTMQMYNATAQVLKLDITNLDDGDHIVTITNAAGKVSPLGSREISANTKGVQNHRFAIGGAKSSDFLSTVAFSMVISQIQADLLIISFLKNDQTAEVSLETFRANLMAYINEQVQYGDVLLMNTSGLFEDSGATIKNVQYSEIMKDISDTIDHVAFYDIAADMGGDFATADAAGFLYGGHMSTTGQQFTAERLCEVLGANMYAPKKLDAVNTTALSNVITFDLERGRLFRTEIKTTNATTIALANLPDDDYICFVTRFRCRATASITDLSGITWSGGSAPTYTENYTYEIKRESFDGGETWYNTLVGTYALPIEVVTYTNMLNGNAGFEDGTNNWLDSGGVPPVTNAEYHTGTNSLDVSGTSSKARTQTWSAEQMAAKGVNVGDKLYVYCYVKCTARTAGNIGGRIVVNGGYTDFAVNAITSGWQLVSAIVTFAAGTLTVYAASFSSANLTGYIDDYGFVNLTAEFGVGSEPNKTWCDANIPGNLV